MRSSTIRSAIAEIAEEEYGVHLCEWEALHGLDALIFAVAHSKYLEMGVDKLLVARARGRRRGGRQVGPRSCDASPNAAWLYWSL